MTHLNNQVLPPNFKYESGGTMNTSIDEFTVKRFYKLAGHIAGDLYFGNDRVACMDDLISEGVEAAIGAYGRFNPEINDNLNAFIRIRIRGAIIDELRRLDPYSRGMRKNIKELQSHMNINNGSIVPSIICKKLKIEVE